MKRREETPQVSGLEYVEGEGGEPLPTVDVGVGGDTPDASLPDDTDYGGDTGTVGGASSLKLEVDILATAAVDRVAREIARRVARQAERSDLKSVTIVSSNMVAFLRLHEALSAEVSSLEEIADRAEAAFAAAPDDTLEGGFVALPALGAGVEGIRRVAQSAASAMKKFVASYDYSGRDKVAQQVVLDAALAKHLAGRDLTVSVPERSLPERRSASLIARILKLQTRCRELQGKGVADEQIGPVVDAVESLVSTLFGTADERAVSVPLAQRLMLADGVAAAFREGHAVLFADLVFSGGSYRTRKWLLNIFFGRDNLTYSGGAGVTFFLYRGKDRATLDSDTIYFASPHESFVREDHGRPRASNIPPSKDGR